MKQLVIVNPDGSLEGLEHKKGKGVNLKQLGKAKVERVTLIKFSESLQMWFIEWTDAVLKKDNSFSKVWDVSFIDSLGVDVTEYGGEVISTCNYHGDSIAFEDYDDAVKLEVATIQELQRSGRSKEVF